jgi:signal transduction histidine kinase
MAIIKRKPRLGKYAERAHAKTPVDENSHIAQEIYRKNVELAHTNQTLSLLRTIDGLVLAPENTMDDLVSGITRALVENPNYTFSAIFMRQHDDDDYPMALAGLGLGAGQQSSTLETADVKKIKMHLDLDWFKSNDYSKTIDLSEAEQPELRSLFDDGDTTMKVLTKQLNTHTICLVKLLARRKLVGVLVVGVITSVTSLNLTDLEYLGRIGEAAGVAMDNKLLFEENQKVLKQLQRSNAKLKALDETKDEFISMASHQLRTPLTSVKGYVSMVIEGDAGKLNEKQKKLLDQAFISSQRMVYLIADLLNVSRLHSGKFIIERKPTQLADVIEGELSQLRETAKARNIKLVYVKPKNFPELMLDETKTRQVVMNFADNAIYYTPSGGTIHVELKDKGTNIEYAVIDNGIGVPKSAQHHLFTKFYRADNARQTRPDGTGLGLFMAKKVVIAQGGAIIFKSEEGKGSTFGFTFPKTLSNTVN